MTQNPLTHTLKIKWLKYATELCKTKKQQQQQKTTTTNPFQLCLDLHLDLRNTEILFSTIQNPTDTWKTLWLLTLLWLMYSIIMFIIWLYDYITVMLKAFIKAFYRPYIYIWFILEKNVKINIFLSYDNSEAAFSEIMLQNLNRKI